MSTTNEAVKALTPPTPENVAEMLTCGDGDYHDGNDWHPSITANGNVIAIGITPVGKDYETELPKVHFRAVVVEGEETPIVLEQPAEGELAGADDRTTRVLETLERLEWAITAPASDADLLDAALTDTRILIEAARQPVGRRT